MLLKRTNYLHTTHTPNPAGHGETATNIFADAKIRPSAIPLIVLVLVVVLIVGPKLFIEPGTKAFFRLSSVSDPGL